MPHVSLRIVENPQTVDWLELHKLVLRAYAFMDERIDPPSSLHRMDAAAFRQKADDETLIICTHNDSLVGCMFCRLDGAWLYVGKVAVDPHWQGQGIGRKLFDQAFSLARRLGATGLELQTRVELTENHRAFEKLGFTKTGQTTHKGYARPTSITMRAKM